MGYVYYARLEFPEFPKPENPMGLFRAPEGNVYKIESFRRDFTWQYSEELSRAFLNGDTLTVVEISEETAKKAVRNISGKDISILGREVI